MPHTTPWALAAKELAAALGFLVYAVVVIAARRSELISSNTSFVLVSGGALLMIIGTFLADRKK